MNSSMMNPDHERAPTSFTQRIYTLLDDTAHAHQDWSGGDVETEPALSLRSFQDQLRDAQMLGVLDPHTICRALHPVMLTRAVQEKWARLTARGNEEQPPVTIISRHDAYVEGSSILCVDLDALGLEAARRWAEKHGEQARRDGRFLVVAIGRNGHELSSLIGVFHAMVSRPLIDSATAWAEAVRPAWLAHQYPERVDALPASETHGGVSKWEFEESIFQATLRSDDRRRRD